MAAAERAMNPCEQRRFGKEGYQCRLLVLSFLSICLIGNAIGDLAIETQCKKVVAFFALQTTTVDGVGASYLGESSSKYQQHLKVALMSIRENCPSIQPVIVSMYPLPKATVAWIRMLEADVLIHKLTFSEDVLRLAELPDYAWVKGVISTYLRTEVPSQSPLPLNTPLISLTISCNCRMIMQVHLIMKKYSQLVDRSPKVDLTYVIWGDLDTIWLKDFNSCSLAKPTILSVTG